MIGLSVFQWPFTCTNYARIIVLWPTSTIVQLYTTYNIFPLFFSSETSLNSSGLKRSETASYPGVPTRILGEFSNGLVTFCFWTMTLRFTIENAGNMQILPHDTGARLDQTLWYRTLLTKWCLSGLKKHQMEFWWWSCTTRNSSLPSSVINLYFFVRFLSQQDSQMLKKVEDDGGRKGTDSIFVFVSVFVQ